LAINVISESKFWLIPIDTIKNYFITKSSPLYCRPKFQTAIIVLTFNMLYCASIISHTYYSRLCHSAKMVSNLDMQFMLLQFHHFELDQGLQACANFLILILCFVVIQILVMFENHFLWNLTHQKFEHFQHNKVRVKFAYTGSLWIGKASWNRPLQCGQYGQCRSLVAVVVESSLDTPCWCYPSSNSFRYTMQIYFNQACYILVVNPLYYSTPSVFSR